MSYPLTTGRQSCSCRHQLTRPASVLPEPEGGQDPRPGRASASGHEDEQTAQTAQTAQPGDGGTEEAEPARSSPGAAA